MRESNYWLRLIRATTNFEGELKDELNYLISESAELKRILGRISSTTRNNLNKH